MTLAREAPALAQDATVVQTAPRQSLDTKATAHWPFLDLLRFSAAMLVLLGHLRGLTLVPYAQIEQHNPFTTALYLVSGLQHEGVVIFFIVSGFLVGGSVWRLIAQARFDLGTYLINRFARIYLVFIPALLFVLVLTTVGHAFLADGRFYGVRPLMPSGIFDEWTWPQIPCHLAAVQGLMCLPWGANPPFWSLGYEWALYLFAPALFGALFAPMPLRRRLASCAGVALIFAALNWWNPDWPFWCSLWVLGAIASRLLTTGWIKWPLGVAGLAFAAAALVISRTAVVVPVVTDACLALGLTLGVACPTILQRVGHVGAIARGAAFSYSLYAIHLPVCVFIGALLERFAGWPREVIQPDLRGLTGFVVILIGALAAARVFAYFTEDRTAAVRAWLMNLRASFAHVPEKWIPVLRKGHAQTKL
jgi:peptidoglycan/LPS O-acetylase OafA/YrhL